MAINFPAALSLIPAGCPRIEDDFTYSSSQFFNNWNSNQVGASFAAQTPTANQFGVMQTSLGIGAGNFSVLSRGLGQFVIPASVFWQFNFGFILPAISVAADRFIVRVGLGDINTNAEFNNGVYFEYSDNLSLGAWRCKAANGGVRTLVPTARFVTAGTKNSLKAYGFDNKTAIFSINGAVAAAISTNFPTGVALGLCIGFYNVTSTAPHLMQNDYAALYYNVSR